MLDKLTYQHRECNARERIAGIRGGDLAEPVAAKLEYEPCRACGAAGMSSRVRLPNRRSSESFDFDCLGLSYTATISRFSDGRLAEIFLSNHKQRGRLLARPTARCQRRCNSLCIAS